MADDKDKFKKSEDKKPEGARPEDIKPSVPEIKKPSLTGSAPIVKPLPLVGIDQKVVAFHKPKDHISEQFRTLRTHIYSLKSQDELKTIVISSSSHKEGKSITALNLSVIIAQHSKKPVLIIDANLRSPSIEKYLGLDKNTAGLGDILSDTAPDISTIIKKSKVENLNVITAGKIPTNPPELLGSQKMKDLLSNLKNQYEAIILDTPAVMPYADTRILGPLVDGVILVALTSKTRREAILRSEDILKNVGTNLLGYTLTGIKYPIPEYIHRHL